MSDQRSTPNPYSTPVAGTPEAQAQGSIAAQRTALPSELGVKPSAALQRAFLTQAFVWMFVGLIVSAGVATWVTTNENLLAFAYNSTFILLIAQIALVVAISWGIRRISATLALGLFFIYAASMGVTLGAIVYVYSAGPDGYASVATAFLSAAAVFGAAAIYGATTKRNLVGLGGILFIGLIGIIAASVLNIFFQSNELTWVISIVGVVIFTALTAYDVQRIQNGDLAVWTGSVEKAAVLGALSLYLDFVNIFLFFLRIFGGRD